MSIPRVAAVAALCLVMACGSSDSPGDPPGTGGAGGTGTGGRGGRGGGGTGASAGGSGAGGSGGSQAMAGGGGAVGSGGQAMAGAGGSGAGSGGTAGAASDAGAAAGSGGSAGGADAGPGSEGGSGNPDGAGDTPGAMVPGGNSPLTVGWNQRPFTFKLQKPHNLPLEARYTFDQATNTHTMWVNSNDASHEPPPNSTDPRTEMRWLTEYGSGSHMFDADVWIAPGTNRSCIMQVFGAAGSATTIMLTAWSDGSIRRYFGTGTAAPGGAPLVADAFGRWWNLKLMHDTGAGQIRIYADDKLVATYADRGGSSHHFKNGVYGTTGRSETRWRNIRYWVK